MKTPAGKVFTKVLASIADQFLKHEWVVLGLIALPMLFMRAEWTPVMLVIPALWGLRKLRQGVFIPRTPLNVPLLLLSVTLLVSLWATFSIQYSLAKISGLLFGIAVFFAVARLPARWFGKAVAVFLLAGLAIALLGLVATTWPKKISILRMLGEEIPRLVQALPGAERGVHPNELAGVLTLFAPLAVALAAGAWWTRSRKAIAGKVLLPLAAALLTGVLVLTQSRSGLLALAAALGLMLAVSGRVGRVLLALAILGAAVAVVRLGPETFLGGEGALQAVVPGEVTLASRFEIWNRALYGLQDFAFTGMGLGTFRRVAPILYPFFLIAPDFDVAHAHNMLLQTGLDLGIPGLIAYLALCLTAFCLLLTVWRRGAKVPGVFGVSARTLALGLAAGLLAHFVFGLTDAVALGARPGFLWWMLLGLAAALYRQLEKREIRDQKSDIRQC